MSRRALRRPSHFARLTLPLVSVSAVLLAAAPLAAQEEPELTWPDGWTHRFDREGSALDELYFVGMPPGFHVTTGPAVILYHPDSTAVGDFRLESEIFLFDPGQRREGYGVFFGGRDLEGDEIAYTYFLLRRTGEFLVKRRMGAETETVIPWTAHPAILPWEDRDVDAATAQNILAVEARGAELRFLVNGHEVASIPRDEVDVDGVVGLRVNHALDLHVSRLEVTPGS